MSDFDFNDNKPSHTPNFDPNRPKDTDPIDINTGDESTHSHTTQNTGFVPPPPYSNNGAYNNQVPPPPYSNTGAYNNQVPPPPYSNNGAYNNQVPPPPYGNNGAYNNQVPPPPYGNNGAYNNQVPPPPYGNNGAYNNQVPDNYTGYQPANNSKSISSFIMGLLSLLMPCIGIVFGILALIFANQVKPNESQGMDKAGKVMGIVGLCINGIILLFYIFAFMIALGSSNGFH